MPTSLLPWQRRSAETRESWKQPNHRTGRNYRRPGETSPTTFTFNQVSSATGKHIAVFTNLTAGVPDIQFDLRLTGRKKHPAATEQCGGGPLVKLQQLFPSSEPEPELEPEPVAVETHRHGHHSRRNHACCTAQAASSVFRKSIFEVSIAACWRRSASAR